MCIYKVKFSDEIDSYSLTMSDVDVKASIRKKLETKWREFIRINRSGINYGNEYTLYPHAMILDHSSGNDINMELQMWFAPEDDIYDAHGSIDSVTATATLA